MTARVEVSAELRVGMSVFWACVTVNAGMRHVTWMQGGQMREVWVQGSRGEALAEARRVARELDAKTATVSS